jgi:GT2 family glycosyltransferase
MIDVIVPVYKGLEQTRRCIESVMAHRQAAPIEVVAVDDATPEPAIAAYLDDAARAGRITLLRNANNEGFVRSVNRGMSLHGDRDVILLNSDAEVANDWVDRLHAAAYREADIATVTPFSNNATICSYPFETWGEGVPGTLGLAALDREFAAANAGRAVDIPTAVGFCMYIRRDALERLGLFDAERFGRGYGEENDFCMRALKAGLRNVLAGDVFVYHEGAVSFSSEREQLTQAAGKALAAVHPEYPGWVQDFRLLDSTAPLRHAVDHARAAHGIEEAKRVIDERALERTSIVRDILGLDEIQADRLERVNTQLAAQAARVRALEEEILRLRAGLAHAESLALERYAELDRIHRTLLWRCANFVWRRIAALRTRGAA